MATHSFVLKFTDDERQVPEHESYRLSFTAENGHLSKDSMIYRIVVSRDLPPEIEILTPRDHDIELAANGTQRIEIRAIDPDYALSSVSLRAVASGGGEIVNEKLSIPPEGHTGQATLTYNFSPSKLGLVPGNKVTYYAVAEDNRTSLQDGKSLDPNRERTIDYSITIVGGQTPPAGSEGNSSEQQSGAESPKPEQPSAKSPGETGANQQSGDPQSSAESSPSSEQGDQGSQDDQGTAQPQPSGAQENQSQEQPSGDSQQATGTGRTARTGRTTRTARPTRTGRPTRTEGNKDSKAKRDSKVKRGSKDKRDNRDNKVSRDNGRARSDGRTVTRIFLGGRAKWPVSIRWPRQLAGQLAGDQSPQDSGSGSSGNPSPSNSQGQPSGSSTPQTGSDSGGDDNATPDNRAERFE